MKKNEKKKKNTYKRDEMVEWTKVALNFWPIKRQVSRFTGEETIYFNVAYRVASFYGPNAKSWKKFEFMFRCTSKNVKMA